MTQLRPHSPPAALSPPLAALLAEADSALRRLDPEDPHQLYALLYHLACRVAPVDAFYLCLYSEADQTLYFPYNVEGDVYDLPLTIALGSGPTSQVIKKRRAVIWNTYAEARAFSGIMFGQMDRFTHSAIHVPIFGPPGRPADAADLLGVLSIQAYPAGAYPPQTVHALHALADRTGTVLARARADAAWQSRLRAADAGTPGQPSGANARPLVAMADEFVSLLHSLRGRADAARRLLPPDADPALVEALEELAEAHCAAQTAASQLPLRPDLCPAPNAALSALTLMERTVLQCLASGQPNKAIAAALYISDATVKFHCKHIFQKLGVTSRTAAIRLWLDAAPRP